MSIRDRIWYDLVETRVGEEYLTLYLNRIKARRKWYKVALVVFSTSGALGWSISENYPSIVCAVIAITQLTEKVQNHFIMSDDDFSKLGQYRVRYVEKYNSLEKLWYELDLEKINETEALERFYTIRTDSCELEAIDNSLDLPEAKELAIKAEEIANNYIINRNYG